MNANELNKLQQSGESHLLLNVLPEEIHAARRIPGSLNACVYEMVFLDKVAELAPSKETPIIVYGAGGSSLDSKVAAERLRAAGYSRVSCFEDGLAGWEAAGLPFEGAGKIPATPVVNGIYRIDATASVIRWTGRNLFNQHYGSIRLASGEIGIHDGVLSSAGFSVDMNSMTCDDLTDNSWNSMLIAHLKSPDFFQTDLYPKAEFVAESAVPIPSGGDGLPSHVLKGRFTLRGVTRPVEFPVCIASADGKRLTGQGVLEVNRTEFGSIYGSGRFFRFLGKHLVNDLIHLDVMIHADLAD